MFKTKAELIADLKAKNASKEDIVRMEDMTPEDLVNAGLIEGKQVDVASKGVNVTSESTTPGSTELESERFSWESQHKKNRKKLEENLKKQKLQEIDIIRELQNFDDEELLKFKNDPDKYGTVLIPEVKVGSKIRKSTSDILNPEDYNEKIIGDDAVENTNNWLNSYIGSRGFKAIETSLGDRHQQQGQFIKIMAANGNEEVFNLKKTGVSYTSERTGAGVEYAEANSLEDITTWLDNQEISEEQKYIFNLTNQTPDENGLYDIKLLNKKDINPTFDTERQISTNGYNADKDQLEVITSLVHSSIEKAITNPESMGLSARYSSVRAGELSEDDKLEIRNAVFDRVNKKTDVKINKKDFNKLFVMYDGIVQQINIENNNAKNLTISGEELDPKFKQEREDIFLASLNKREKIKYGLLREIEQKEEEL